MKNPVLDIVNNLSQVEGTYLLSKIEKASEKGYLQKPICNFIRHFHNNVSHNDDEKIVQMNNANLSKSYKKFIDKLKIIKINASINKYTKKYHSLLNEHQTYNSEFEQYINETLLKKQRKIDQEVIGQNGKQQNSAIQSQKNMVFQLDTYQEMIDEKSLQYLGNDQEQLQVQFDRKYKELEDLLKPKNRDASKELENYKLMIKYNKEGSKEDNTFSNPITIKNDSSKTKEKNSALQESTSSTQKNGSIQSRKGSISEKDQEKININFSQNVMMSKSETQAEEKLAQARKNPMLKGGWQIMTIHRPIPFKVQRNVQKKSQKQKQQKELSKNQLNEVRNSQEIDSHENQRQHEKQSTAATGYNNQFSHEDYQNDVQNLKDDIFQYDHVQLQFDNQYIDPSLKYQAEQKAPNPLQQENKQVLSQKEHQYKQHHEQQSQQSQQQLNEDNSIKIDIERIDLSLLPEDLQELGQEYKSLHHNLLKDIFDRNFTSNGQTMEEKISQYHQRRNCFEDKYKLYHERMQNQIIQDFSITPSNDPTKQNGQNHHSKHREKSLSLPNNQIHEYKKTKQKKQKKQNQGNQNSSESSLVFHKYPEQQKQNSTELKLKDHQQSQDSNQQKEILPFYQAKEQEREGRQNQNQNQQEQYFKGNQRLGEDSTSRDQIKSVTSYGEESVRKNDKDEKSKKEKPKQMAQSSSKHSNFSAENKNKINDQTFNSLNATLQQSNLFVQSKQTQQYTVPSNQPPPFIPHQIPLPNTPSYTPYPPPVHQHPQQPIFPLQHPPSPHQHPHAPHPQPLLPPPNVAQSPQQQPENTPKPPSHLIPHTHHIPHHNPYNQPLPPPTIQRTPSQQNTPTHGPVYSQPIPHQIPPPPPPPPNRYYPNQQYYNQDQRYPQYNPNIPSTNQQYPNRNDHQIAAHQEQNQQQQQQPQSFHQKQKLNEQEPKKVNQQIRQKNSQIEVLRISESSDSELQIIDGPKRDQSAQQRVNN